MDNKKLSTVFEEFWDKNHQRTVLEGKWLTKGVRVGVELLPDEDIRMGMFSPEHSGYGRFESYDDDPDTIRYDFMAYYSRNPHLAENQKAVVDRILFQHHVTGSRFDVLADLTVIESVDGGKSWRKRMHGRFSVLSFDDVKDVSRFLQMAKDSLARRKRPVIIVSDVTDLD